MFLVPFGAKRHSVPSCYTKAIWINTSVSKEKIFIFEFVVHPQIYMKATFIAPCMIDFNRLGAKTSPEAFLGEHFDYVCEFI